MKSEGFKEWKELIKQQKASGLKVTRWCQEHQVTKATYYYWNRKIREQEEKKVADAPNRIEFVEVTSMSKEKVIPHGLNLRWKNVVIDISTSEDIPLAAELIKQLREIC